MKIFVYLLCSLWLSLAVHAAELKFKPATPIVEINKTVVLSVTNGEGTVKWIAGDGKIQEEGNQVTYLAPDQAGLDAVTVLDSKGNTGLIKVVITTPNDFSLENAQWKIFTDRSSIQAVLPSEDGKTLWVGTNGGLEKRDAQTGEIQQVFMNTDGLPNNNVTELLSDGQNGLWVGTYGGGLAHYNNQGQWQVFDENSGLPNNKVTTLLGDGQNGLWVGTSGGGLAHYISSQGQWQVFDEKSGLPSNWINSLLSDGQNGLWVGTLLGLARYNNRGEWQVFTPDNSILLDYSVSTLLSDGQNGLWVGTGKGLAHYNKGQWQLFTTKNSGLPSNSIVALLSDGQDGLWVGMSCELNENNNKCEGGGFAHYIGQGQWQVVNMENSGFSNHVVSFLLSDGQNGLWIGTSEGLAHYSNQGQWQMVFNVNVENSGLPFDLVRTLSSDGQNGLWVGTSGKGLAHYISSQGQWQVFTRENSDLPGDWVSALLSDGQNGLWVGTSEGLAYYSSQGQWQVFDEKHGLPSNFITALSSDGQNGLWVGTRGGLAHHSSQGQWQVFNTKNSGLSDYDIESLLSDDQNDLWFGIWKGGLAHAHYSSEEQWQVFTGYKLPDDNVQTLLSDGQNGLWVGTRGGLAHYNNQGQWQVFTQESSGLPSNDVQALLSDGQNGVWVGTSGGGLAHYSNQGELQVVFNTENSGLHDNRIAALLSDGKNGLWVGTWNGLAHLTFGRKTELCSQSQIDSATCRAIQQGKNAAIIIAAGGVQRTDSLWENTEAITTRIYEIFDLRGFNKSNIYYLSPKIWVDFNGDGRNDRVNRINEDRHLTVDDLKKAFEWAKIFGKLDYPLYFFFMDHGEEGKLHLAPNLQLSAEELKSLLDDYQAATGNQLIAVIEACHSGSLIPALTAPNRAIITSAKAEEKAYFFEKKGFSRFFADSLLKGQNFSEAFQLATRDQKKLLGKNLQFQTAGGAGMTTQTPQLDDNNDGKYEPTQDNNWLKTIYVTVKFPTADTLAIENLTPAATLSVGQPIQLQAKATVAQGTVKRVWAVIRPPKLAQVIDTSGTPILAFPRVNLVQSTESTDTWQTTWNDATYNGNYTLTFYAEDNEKNIASSEQDTVLTVSGGIEPPAKAQVQIQLDKTRYQRGESFKATLTEDLGWGYDLYAAVVMPDGNYFTLKDTNELRGVKEAKPWYVLRKQGQAITLFDLPLPTSLPTGQYCIYGILSPEQNDVFEAMNKNLWVYGQQCFELF